MCINLLVIIANLAESDMNSPVLIKRHIQRNINQLFVLNI